MQMMPNAVIIIAVNEQRDRGRAETRSQPLRARSHTKRNEDEYIVYKLHSGPRKMSGKRPQTHFERRARKIEVKKMQSASCEHRQHTKLN